MLGLPLAFTVPGVLAALAGLPILYILLRLTPPRPRTIPLPPLRLILDLVPKDETPATTPPWLLLLRVAVAALVVLAMAGPVWNPPPSLGAGRGPLLILVDDGFAAAPTWEARIALVRQRLQSAERAGRLAAAAVASDGARAIEVMPPERLTERLRALRPVPVEPERSAPLPAIAAFAAAHVDTDILWIADGLERGGARAFGEALVKLPGVAAVTVVEGGAPPVALAGAANTAESLEVRVVRADAGGAARGVVRGVDAKGLPVAEAPFGFEGAATETKAHIALPVELRNDVTRLAVADVASAGAVTLLDGRSKRRRVAVVSGGTADVAQPLLSPDYYIAKALAPFAAVTQPRGAATDPIVTLLGDQPSVLVLADVGAIAGLAHSRLTEFVEGGGVLIRFAGSRLAAASDDLVPVTLRRGGRTFGGALSWDKPKPLAPFDGASPFAGLAAHDAVTVSRQVLAEPDAGLPGRTWAQLTDGTPLVTAEKRGKGLIVLFHITADTTWSTLPLSGLFVDMLRRLVDLSPGSVASPGTAGSPQASTGEASAAIGATRTLDGFGVLGPPPATARPIPASFDGAASLDHPPGYYGPPDAAVALNALREGETLAPLDLAGLAVERQSLETAEPVDLRATLITLALLGFLADGFASLWLGGGFRRRRAVAAALLALALAAPVVTGAPPARADETSVSKRDMDAALATRMGYVVTGDATIDDTSRLGLASLSRALADRTSLAPGDPVGLDPKRDELAFYPLLYWPVLASAPQPAPATVDRIASYMKGGGTIVFDTRDALTSRPGGPLTPEAAWLRTMLAGVDVPELEPVPSDHVVTKTFYLIAGFVGRYASGQTWIEALPPAAREEADRPARAGDSVSPIVITGNDLAAGWAATPEGEPLYPLVPGGARQRELALRGGINLVMYTLTGNYKADQVHVRDLLERLAH